MKRLLLAATAAGVLICAPATAQVAGKTPPLLALKVKPTELDVAARTATLEVTMVVEGVATPAGKPLLTHLNGAPNIALPFRVEGLAATDDKGDLPLASKDGGRTYTAARDAVGKLTVTYRRPISAATGGSLSTIPTVDGPGVSGIANMLFPLPTSAQRYHLTMDWDLSAMPAGSTAVTSVGEGLHIDAPSVPMAKLNYIMIMAGKIKREPDPPVGSFSAVWTGDPTFDAAKAMQWASRLHHFMSRFFADPVELPYHVFMRAHAGGNGVAAPMAFTIGYNARTTPEGVESLLGHEMTHTWTAADIGKWYSEGNAVYYQTLLPWRAGMMPTEKRLRDINLTAVRYYTNDVLNAPDSDVLPNFWSDMRYNVLSYDRGALYFAVLNGKIRRKSGGKRSVDDLIRAMVQLDREDKPITEQTWVDLLQKELGDEGPAIHKGMMSGTLRLVPESDDYGPCFRRISTRIGRYDVGFGGPEIKNRPVVENLRPDSNAAKAGLREGDKVTSQTSTDGAQKDPNMTLTLHVTRGDQKFDVTYVPRGELRDVYQWERVPGVPESACK
jgi:hypothetical protein